MSESIPDPRSGLRLRPGDRQAQLTLTPDAAIAPDDEVRAVEALARQVDCSALDAAIRSRAGTPGPRPTTPGS